MSAQATKQCNIFQFVVELRVSTTGDTTVDPGVLEMAIEQAIRSCAHPQIEQATVTYETDWPIDS